MKLRGLIPWLDFGVIRTGIRIVTITLAVQCAALADNNGVTFDIPRLRADEALTVFAQQADLPILFPYEKVSRLMANPLEGQYGIEEALGILLEGTGLSATIGQTGQVMVQVALNEEENPNMNTTSSSRRRRGRLGGALAAVIVGATGAGNAPAQVTQSASARAMLEEVVVTARRREESLTDLPLSVAALSADAMQAQGVYDIMHVGGIVPNVQFQNTDRRGITAIFIRGIGNDATGALPPVGAGIYLDGHYMPNTLGQMLNTVDIERIEVLRGPQGTLFGKNTTGGAINVVTAAPAPEFESRVVARVGEYGEQAVRGMINVPFSDTVAGRFSLAKETTDGVWYNRTLGRDYGRTDVEAIAGTIRITPNDNWMFDVSLRGNYQEDDNAGGQCRPRPLQATVDNLAANDRGEWTGPTYEDGVPQWGGGLGHLERLYPGATIGYWEACQTDNEMGPYVTSGEKDGYLSLDNEFYNVMAQWDSAGQIGRLDNLNIKMIAGKHDLWYDYVHDRDFTPLMIDASGLPPEGGAGGQSRYMHDFEVLFTGDVSDRLSFVAGVHWMEDENTNGTNCLNVLLANFAALSNPEGDFSVPCERDGGTQFEYLADKVTPGGPVMTGMGGYIRQESIAAFGHVTFALNDNWTLDFGARYTEDERTYHLVEMAAVDGTCTHTNPGDPPITQLCSPDFLLTYNNAFIDGIYHNRNATFDAVTPMFSATRHLGDNMMYFLYSEGFLSGSFNDSLNTYVNPETDPLVAFGPEYVSNYEVGYKGSFRDGRLRLATAVFYMDYKDKHVPITIDNSDGRFGPLSQFTLTTNAGKAEIYGVELELRAQPWDGGFLTVDLGHLQNEFREFNTFDPNAPGGGAIVDQSNLTIRDYSPEWTLNVMVEHAFSLRNGATLTPQIGWNWRDDYEWISDIDRNAPPSFCFQSAYARMRTRVTYEPPTQNWQVALYGSNITDELYLDYCAPARTGVFDYRYGDPSRWGVEFTYNWGNN